MMRRYFLTNTNSDLTGGLDFNYEADPTDLGVLSIGTFSIAQAATETSYGFTPPLHPGVGAGNITGTYTANVDITTSNTNLSMFMRLHRINSTGTIQQSTVNTAPISLGTLGSKTFSFPANTLGQFTSTDRMRIDYSVTNAALHNTQSYAMYLNSVTTFIQTPLNTRYTVTT